MRVWLFALLLLLPICAQSQELDYQIFRTLPVLEDGRLKPLDSFAVHMRTRISGSATLDDRPAIAWLAQTLFDPAQAAQERVFYIRNAHIRAQFELPSRTNHLYSLTELAPRLEESAKSVTALLTRELASLTADEQDLRDLHTAILIYNQLLQSFSLLLPLPFAAPPEAKLNGAYTYLDAQKVEPKLMQNLQKLLTPKVLAHPETLTPAQQQLAAFVHDLQKLREGGTNNQLLRILPASWAEQKGEWFAPWQLLLSGQGSPTTQRLLELWQQLAQAYRSGDATRWLQASQELHEQMQKLVGTADERLLLEVLLRDLHVLDVTALFLVLAMGLIASHRRWPRAYSASLIAAALSAASLSTVLLVRSYILARPPVGTLHESVLFVALILLLGTLLITVRRRMPGLALAGQVGTLALLLVAPFVHSDSENMTMLSAVLNTNFWLTVHVLCITAGYGACAATAALAHVHLITFKTASDPHGRLALLHRCSLMALLLTAVGTLLGGVWADQSWGRFWGWDPKENGALIIVLWLMWLQHARLAGQVSELAFTAGMAALGVVVAQAWFGVNLLGTGLHSYGFIQGIALGLFSYTLLNLMLIAGLWWRAKRGSHA